MMPPWLWPVLACVGAAFTMLAAERFFLGLGDSADGLLLVVYALLLGYAWRRVMGDSA